jgi:hypothetical protein
MLKKAMISNAIMLVRNIDKALTISVATQKQITLPFGSNFETSGDSLHSGNRAQKEAQKPRRRDPALAQLGSGGNGSLTRFGGKAEIKTAR